MLWNFWKRYTALNLLAVLMLSASLPILAQPQIKVDPIEDFYPSTSIDCPQWQFEQAVRLIREKSIEGHSQDSLKVNNISGLQYCGVKAVPILREAFANEENRWAVLWALQKIGKQAKDALPEVTVAMRSESDIQGIAIETAGAIGKPALPILIELLKEKNIPIYTTKINIAEALGNIGMEAKSSVPMLQKLLKSLKKDDLDEKFRIAKALKQLGENRLAISTTINILQNLPTKYKKIRDSANDYFMEENSLKLAEIGSESPEVVSRLIYLLQYSRNQFTRSGAAFVLAAFNKKAKMAIPVLSKILKTEKNSRLLTNASLALLAIGDDAHHLVTPAITLAVINSNNETSGWDDLHEKEYRLLFIVKSLKIQMKSQVPKLLAALNGIKFSASNIKNDSSESLQQLLIKVLGAIGSNANQAVPTLIRIANEKNNNNRYDAIDALAEIRPDANQIIPTLIDIMNEEVSKNNRITINPLGVSGRKNSSIAINAIGVLGANSKEAISALKKKLTNSSVSIFDKVDIIKALVTLGEIDFASLSLIELCSQVHQKPYLKPQLMPINPSSVRPKRGVPRIITITPNNTPVKIKKSTLKGIENYTPLERSYFFDDAAKVFNRIGTRGIPILVKELKQLNPSRKHIAIFGLSEIPQLSPEATSLLQTIINDERTDLDTRRLAAYALEGNNTNNMEPFFNRYHLVSSKKAQCGDAGDGDLIRYTGQCRKIFKGLNGGASLFEAIKKVLFPSSGK